MQWVSIETLFPMGSIIKVIAINFYRKCIFNKFKYKQFPKNLSGKINSKEFSSEIYFQLIPLSK